MYIWMQLTVVLNYVKILISLKNQCSGKDMLQIHETKLYSLNLGIYEKFIAQIVLFIRNHYQLNNCPLWKLHYFIYWENHWVCFFLLIFYIQNEMNIKQAHLCILLFLTAISCESVLEIQSNIKSSIFWESTLGAFWLCMSILLYLFLLEKGKQNISKIIKI